MDTANLKLKDMWILIPTLVLFAGFIVWPEFAESVVKIILIALGCAFGAIWLADRFATRRRNRTLRDGADICVELHDDKIAVFDNASDDWQFVPLNKIESVYIVAADALPIGRISYLIEHQGEITEIPLDADGANLMLSQLQVSLSGFDNNALIDAASMLNGTRQIWKRPENAAPKPIEVIVEQTIAITGRGTAAILATDPKPWWPVCTHRVRVTKPDGVAFEADASVELARMPDHHENMVLVFPRTTIADLPIDSHIISLATVPRQKRPRDTARKWWQFWRRH